MNSEEQEFIDGLENRVHYVKNGTFRPNMGGRSFGVQYDQYTSEGITAEEAERLMTIIEDDGNQLILYPINTAMGFRVGYEVLSFDLPFPGAKPEFKRELVVTDNQLPEGYKWGRMSEVFMRARNLELVDFLGLRPIENRRSAYEY